MNTKYKAILLIIIAVWVISSSSFTGQEDYPLLRLTSNSAQEGFPTFSPDGASIYYSLVNWEDTIMTGLWNVSVSGGEPIQIVRGFAEHPDCSHDGKLIVFDAEAGNSIKLVSSSGGRPIRIVPENIRIFKGGTPCWSPDGSMIAFREENKLRLLEVETGTTRILYEQIGKLPIPSCWTKDGKCVIFFCREEMSSKSAIIRVNIDNGEIFKLTHNEENCYRYSALSPDGKMLVYVSKESGNYNLWVMPAEGGRSIQLTSGQADDGPCWSPDGQSIAFVSNRSGNADIWLLKIDRDYLWERLEINFKEK